jgi:hypothetical protein
MYLPHLGSVFIFSAQEGPASYLINSISPVLQVLICTAKMAMKNVSTVRIVFDITEAVNFPHKHKC